MVARSPDFSVRAGVAFLLRQHHWTLAGERGRRWCSMRWPRLTLADASLSGVKVRHLMTRRDAVASCRRHGRFVGLHHAEKTRGDRVARVGENLMGRSFLDDRAAAEKHDAIGAF